MEFPWRCNVDTIAMDLKVSWEMSVCNVVNFFLGLAMWFVIYTVLVSTLFVLIMVVVME